MILALILALAQESSPIRFAEIAAASGVRFANMYGGVGAKRYILETTGTGAALFDYDGDRDLDLFLVNGSRLGYTETQSFSNALYRNDGAGRFTDVTGPAGLEARGWGQGAAVVDYENDGDFDLFVTYYGANRFYRNRGDGTFVESAAELGLDDPRWGAGAAFGDLDRDGTSDLVVVHYVDFDPETTPGPGEAPNCFFLGMPVMCGPRGLKPAPAILYRGRPEGGFEAVRGAGIGDRSFYGLGVTMGDLDRDGDLDVYVANDQTPNNLYRNDTADGGGALRFREIGLEAGIAFNEDGRAQAGMGVSLGDSDNDGWLDIVVTNFSHDHNTLYRSTGDGWFVDDSFAAGIGEPSYSLLGWGAGFADFDRDGWLDLLVVNGHVYPEVRGPVTESAYAQPALLFRNLGTGEFAVVPDPALAVPRVFRGAAFGDIDGDGDPDVAAAVMNGAPALFRNETQDTNGWVGFRLVGRTSSRDGVGARLELVAGGPRQVREVRSAGSYLSANDFRVFFGLGANPPATARARIRWLSGCEHEVEAPPGGWRLVVEPSGCQEGASSETPLSSANTGTPGRRPSSATASRVR